MAELDLLTQIHENTSYIKQNLEKHIEECQGIRKDYIRPLWEAHQQQKGMAKLGGAIYGALGALIMAAISYFTGVNHK